MNSIHITSYKSPAGELILGSFDNQICLCDWKYRKMRASIDERIRKGLDAEFIEGETEVVKETIRQLEAYFEGELTQFDIPLLPVGTDFQKEVWKKLTEIPFGETRSYLQLSKDLGNPDAIRAVASANGANAISILIPCHRIIGSDGSLVGYAGGLDAKKRLLKLEKAEIQTDKAQLKFF
ncbi:methylated-DNA--[protein]-cysteine S-methyltransferase [Algoriphagus kandeliae]|uniref:Methylated-DNA--protein-cysteine methyltransferase n=1 Tax=Algoriphagus kandeliae TaxID=2562278 RepID=A0A4Y9QP01_9BACT|nr:methylated-DNA--[protein]-cysteine S-methyltransferase [Algoriphagus kandeliae]TFV94364.1 methylated-DNA--[protein]-cysteine S-methyltransferase [Algoriphagus kandeliae]